MKIRRRTAIGVTLIVLLGFTSWGLAGALTEQQYIDAGKAEFPRGNYDGAIYLFTAGLELNPDNYYIYNDRGLCYLALGDIDESISDFSKAIELKPDFAGAYFNRGLAYLKTGSKYTPEGRASLEKAISDYSKAVEIKPDYVEAYYHRGVARIEFIHFYDRPFGEAENETFNEALNDFNKTLELDETFYLSYAGMGNAYDRYGEFDEAAKWYNTTLENEYEILQKLGTGALAEIYYSRGRTYQRVEDPQAILDYEKSLEYDPNIDIALGHLASIYSCIGEYEDALELYNRSVEIKESQPALGMWDFHTWEGRGVCYYKAGNYAKAAQDLNKALDVAYWPLLEAYLYLGKICLITGDEVNATEHFNTVIGACSQKIAEAKPWEAIYDSYNIRGLTYIELGEYDKAISDFEKVIELGPKEFPRGHAYYPVEGRKNIGIAYSKMGDKEKAEQFYQEALSIAEERGLQFTKMEIEELLKEL
ncbi:MAG TPA: tetratricopeptide repeat protein [Methanophagales archaeon]|nr:tetratricopeptide repeat protein [Methanophagales archaeon]